MKRLFVSIVFLSLLITALAAEFGSSFTDNTLRVDLGIVGRGKECSLTIDSIAQWPGWYGRRANLTHEQYPEDMQILVIDACTHDTIYVDSKSANVLSEPPHDLPDNIQMFVPKPKRACMLVANVYDYDGSGRKCAQSAVLNLSDDDLSAMHGRAIVNDYRTLRAAADHRHCVNLAIVAEGYTFDETERFYRKAEMLDSALFRQQAFRPWAKTFNVVAVMIPSPESGISVPSVQKHIDTTLSAHFDSFGMERLLTISDTKALWDALENVPVSQVIILANTDKYGGSGAHNEYAIGADGIPHFEEVVIHEFGHSFASLGDEYESGFDDLYSSDYEPAEPNITTLKDFSSKWQNLIDSGVASLIEGAGYQPKGVWRGCQTCLMRAIEDHDFCPVCAQAIGRTVQYLVGE